MQIQVLPKLLRKDIHRIINVQLMISSFLSKEYGWEVSTSEELYLTLHLNRINLSFIQKKLNILWCYWFDQA